MLHRLIIARLGTKKSEESFSSVQESTASTINMMIDEGKTQPCSIAFNIMLWIMDLYLS